MIFDVVVAGLGAAGSATAYHLARRGVRVLGLDRFAPPHTLGSSHGRSRIIREAYFEDPLYVPLVRRAYECWDDLAVRAGRKLFVATGGLMLGPAHGTVVGGARASAIEHGLPFEELSAADVRERFPALRPADGDVAIWEPRAGVLDPEGCVEAHLALAREAGAELRTGTPLLEWSVRPGGLTRVRAGAETIDAAWLVLAAGAWMAPLVADLALPLTVERNVVHWFEPDRALAHFGPGSLPIFIHEFAPGLAWYGFPDLGDGVKLALHHQGEVTTPDTVRRAVDAQEIERVRRLSERYLPGAAGRVRESAVCLYTNTPDGHFIVDRHPLHERVLVASACSGHGFKFSSALGEVLADLVTGARPRFDLDAFRASRFAA